MPGVLGLVSLAVCILLVSGDPMETLAEAMFDGRISGFASNRTYMPGDTAEIYAATSQNQTYTCFVVRKFTEDSPVYSLPKDSYIQSWRDDLCYTSYDPGKDCDWGISASFTVGEWPSAIYEFRCIGLEGSVDFIVAMNPKGKVNQTLFITSSYTSLIYNVWGGRSGYGLFDKDSNSYVDFFEDVQYFTWKRPVMNGPASGASVEAYMNSQDFRDSSIFFHRPCVLSYVDEYPDVKNWATISDDAIPIYGEEYLSKFSYVVFLGKYEYTPISLWNAILKYMQNGGTVFLKVFELLWVYLEEEEGSILIKKQNNNCNHWEGTPCFGPEYSQNISGFEWDRDIFGIGQRWSLLQQNDYIPARTTVVDEDNWVAKQKGWKLGMQIDELGAEYVYYNHAMLTKDGDRYCFTQGTLPCDNVTVIAVTVDLPIHPRTPSFGVDDENPHVNGIVALIRHGNGQVIIISMDWYSGDQFGIPMALSLYRNHAYVPPEPLPAPTPNVTDPVPDITPSPSLPPDDKIDNDDEKELPLAVIIVSSAATLTLVVLIILYRVKYQPVKTEEENGEEYDSIATPEIGLY